MMPIKVFICCDFPLLKQGIVSLLESLPTQFIVNGTSSTLDEAMTAGSFQTSDICLVHLLEDQDLSALIGQRSRLHKASGTKILVMGKSLQACQATISSSEHLQGFVSRELTPEKLVDVLEMLHKGQACSEDDAVYLKHCSKPREPRVKMVVPIKLGNDFGETRDFSAKGIYFAIKNRDMEIDSEISFEMDIDLPNGEAILKCRGKVVRKEMDGKMLGLGVEIIDSMTCPIRMRAAG